MGWMVRPLSQPFGSLATVYFMISKNINKSSDMIFMGPNFLRLSDDKVQQKKSKLLSSPKASGKLFPIKSMRKPILKKSTQPSLHCPPLTTSLKPTYRPQPTSKRSKSRLTVLDHLTSERLRSETREEAISK